MDISLRPLRLTHLPGMEKLDHSLLKEQAAQRLRTNIIRGRIAEGTRLTEREVSQALGVSRMSAHEALIILESQGLVEKKPNGRCVVELTEERIRDLHAVRIPLEKLAVELAAATITAEQHTALLAGLAKLEEAHADGDHVRVSECDLELHHTIWRQAGNSYLLKALEAMLGVMLVLAARTRLFHGSCSDLSQICRAHRELVDLVASGDRAGAASFVEAHLTDAQRLALETFRVCVDDAAACNCGIS